jgi:DNA-binding MarR family transcriptional regulator/ribosomal protein S18 acetylase RimI-like enzyme
VRNTLRYCALRATRRANEFFAISGNQSMSIDAAAHVAGVRQFNRFYTRQIGLLHDGLLGTPFSLTEGRLLYEIAQRGTTTAAELAADLEIDPGYLSRLIRGFLASGIASRERAPTDRRQGVLTLTDHGRRTFAELDRRSQSEIGALLDRLDDDERRRLLAAMATIERLLAPAGSPAAARTFVLRPHRSEDLGWILARHATLYAKEFGWGSQFKLLGARIIADFLRGHDPEREGCWIAECDGEPAGSVMLVDAGGNVAKLRLLLVEPRARGHGIGQRLVDECVRFARAAGYHKITLWTQSVLTAARTIYERAGFVRMEEKPHRSFGVDLVGETWELEL